MGRKNKRKRKKNKKDKSQDLLVAPSDVTVEDNASNPVRDTAEQASKPVQVTAEQAAEAKGQAAEPAQEEASAPAHPPQVAVEVAEPAAKDVPNAEATVVDAQPETGDKQDGQVDHQELEKEKEVEVEEEEEHVGAKDRDEEASEVQETGLDEFDEFAASSSEEEEEEKEEEEEEAPGLDEFDEFAASTSEEEESVKEVLEAEKGESKDQEHEHAETNEEQKVERAPAYQGAHTLATVTATVSPSSGVKEAPTPSAGADDALYTLDAEGVYRNTETGERWRKVANDKDGSHYFYNLDSKQSAWVLPGMEESSSDDGSDDTDGDSSHGSSPEEEPQEHQEKESVAVTAVVEVVQDPPQPNVAATPSNGADDAHAAVATVAAVAQQPVSRTLKKQGSTRKSRNQKGLADKEEKHQATPKQQIQSLMALDGNRQCADCNYDGSTWCSINLGVFLCTECAGAHRSLGPNITKVRSPTLDDKWSPEIVMVMSTHGNVSFNQEWEARMPASAKITPQAGRAERDGFIRAKYARAQWKKRGDEEKKSVAAPTAADAYDCDKGHNCRRSGKFGVGSLHAHVQGPQYHCGKCGCTCQVDPMRAPLRCEQCEFDMCPTCVDEVDGEAAVHRVEVVRELGTKVGWRGAIMNRAQKQVLTFLTRELEQKPLYKCVVTGKGRSGAFQYEWDLSEHVRPGELKAPPSTLDDFLNSENGLARLFLVKRVQWDEDRVRRGLKERVQRLNDQYSINVTFRTTFPDKRSTATFDKKTWASRVVRSRLMDWVCLGSCMWLFGWPVKKAWEDQHEVEGSYAVAVRAEQWLEDNAAGVNILVN